MWKRIFLFCSLMLTALPVGAQTELSVDSVFNEYGRQRGSVLIDLAKDVFGNRMRIEHYKCLIITPDAKDALRIEKAVRSDFERRKDCRNAFIIKEVRESGQLHTASYSLGRADSSSVAEYILYSRHNDKITLVYLTGNFEAKSLTGELEKLKNLFIKVNNKKN